MVILAGDIGGTTTRLEIVEITNGHYIRHYQAQYPSQAYEHLLPIVQTFLQQAPLKPNIACFGVAGPVHGHLATITNLPWQLDAIDMQQTLGLTQVQFINDFAAVGYAIEKLTDRDWVELQQGQVVQQAPIAVIGAGTGLGHCILVWQQDHYEVIAAEAGHTPFAPINDLQISLLQYLLPRLGHVSYENVVSGSGLVNIFNFLQDTKQGTASASLTQALQQQDDQAAIISQFALTQQEPLALQALDLFIQIYAQQTANLALTCLSHGGVYIAGGIAPKLVTQFSTGRFAQIFNQNPSMGHLLQKMPIRLITNTAVGVSGAAWVASRTLI